MRDERFFVNTNLTPTHQKNPNQKNETDYFEDLPEAPTQKNSQQINSEESPPDKEQRPQIQTARSLELLQEGLVILPRLETITVESSDRQTTEQDLLQINTVLSALHQALPHVRSVQSLVTIGKTVGELIKIRRGVKKLQFGTEKDSGGGGGNRANTIEVL